MNMKSKRKFISFLKYFELYTAYQLYDKAEEDDRENFTMMEYLNVS